MQISSSNIVTDFYRYNFLRMYLLSVNIYLIVKLKCNICIIMSYFFLCKKQVLSLILYTHHGSTSRKSKKKSPLKPKKKKKGDKGKKDRKSEDSDYHPMDEDDEDSSLRKSLFDVEKDIFGTDNSTSDDDEDDDDDDDDEDDDDDADGKDVKERWRYLVVKVIM